MKENNKTSSRFYLWAILLALIIAFFLSPWASSLPDGLERVAENLGFMQKAGDGSLTLWKKAPLADYKFPGLAGDGWATAVSGVLGTLIMVALGWGIGRLLRKK
jgi:cobalt/nickel transport protein